jgi:TDG/mug DNA glycosylase family protein
MLVRSSDVTLAEFIKARPVFEAKMRRYAPHAVAFLGKRAFSAITRQAVVRWGLQPETFAEAKAWVLPNPSGLNRGFTLKALVKAYSELRNALKEES